jgi:hypothetical protein
VAALTNITFYQISKSKKIVKKTFLLSNYHQKYSPETYEFLEFDVLTTYVEISHANSLDGTLSKISSVFGTTKQSIQFEAIRHLHKKIFYDYVTPLTRLPNRLQ